MLCVCIEWVNAEHKFRVWVTISGHMSSHFTFTKFVYVWLTGPDCFLNEGQFKAGLLKVKTKRWISKVHDPAAPPEEVSLTLYIFYDYLRIAFAFPQKRGME